ncbi:MAG: hypothetical protein JWQ34_3671 [Mucilaginibacter sp.]|nr:hypothetical protein [Mucilaginibacter sp.]
MIIVNNTALNYVRGKVIRKALLFCLFCLIFNSVWGQAPNISYASGPKVYTVNTAIAPLQPDNTGGAVPTGFNGNVSTFASSGFNTTTAVATDANYVYVCDWGNNLVKKVRLGNRCCFCCCGYRRARFG